MMNISDFLERKIIRHTLLGEAFSPASRLYIMLCTDIMSDGIEYNEIRGDGYVRLLLDNDILEVNNGILTNIDSIAFNLAQSTWSSVRYAAIINGPNPELGRIYYWTEITPGKFIDNTAQFTILPGQFNIIMSGAFSMHLRNSILNWIFKGQPLQSQSDLWVGIGNVFGDNEILEEPDDPLYSRFNTIDYTVLGNQMTNNEEISYVPSVDWGVLDSIGFFASPSGGDLLYVMPITNSGEILANQGIRFLPGSISLKIL